MRLVQRPHLNVIIRKGFGFGPLAKGFALHTPPRSPMAECNAVGGEQHFIPPRREVETAILAGIGVPNMIHCLEQAPPSSLGIGTLVVQPTPGRSPQLRRWLSMNGWTLIDEALHIHRLVAHGCPFLPLSLSLQGRR